MFFARSRSERVGVRMFEQEQAIKASAHALTSFICQSILQFEGIGISDAPQPPDFTQSGRHLRMLGRYLILFEEGQRLLPCNRSLVLEHMIRVRRTSFRKSPPRHPG